MTDQGITDEQLTEWERLANQATPGQWSAADEHGLLEDAEPAWCVSRMEGDKYLYDIAYTTGTNEQADAEFIAIAREAAPALIADLRVSRAREAEWRAATDEWQQRFIAASELAERQQAYREDAEAERDELQHRIDRALALCELLITNATPRQIAGPHEAHNAAVLIRAALTGTKEGQKE